MKHFIWKACLGLLMLCSNFYRVQSFYDFSSFLSKTNEIAESSIAMTKSIPDYISTSEIVSKTNEIVDYTAESSIAIVNNISVYVPPIGEALLDFSKQSFIGVPLEAVSSVMNGICSLVLSTEAKETYVTPNVSDINYVLLTDTENIVIPVTSSEQLWKHPAFDPRKKTVILITGWLTHINESNLAVDLIYEAFRARGDTNFVFIDTAQHLNTVYQWSAFNTEELGEAVGEGLALLTKFIPDEKIHVIGHSLGAHISGAAGQSYQYHAGKLLPRITGLDPAKPCFVNSELVGLMRGDAEFVDIIHTNCGILGKREPIGDADFYPNGMAPLQPGCSFVTCSHSRAYELFAVTCHPGKENTFIASQCRSISSLSSGKCKRKSSYVGYGCSTNVKGNFFFETSGEHPFIKK